MDVQDWELSRRIEACREDYAKVSGQPFQHFYCPILGRDEATEMIRGHIVNDALKTSGVWVPQRKDVDAFYGSAVEADLVAIIQDRGKNPFEIFFDRSLREKHRPKLMCGSESWGYYFPKKSAPPVAGHSPLLVIDQNDNPVCNLALKVAPERLMDVKPGEIQLVVERDYRPPVLASMLKAAHLTMFHIMGYDHVFRSCGLFLADILKQFYIQNQGSHGVSEETIDRHFRRYENMISPLIVENDNWYQGTIKDRMFLALLTGRGEVFALGVIVRAGTDRFCVFLPTDCCINTYFSFLNEPAVSVRAKAICFRPPKDGDSGAWEADKNDMRMPLSQPIPEKLLVKGLRSSLVSSK